MKTLSTSLIIGLFAVACGTTPANDNSELNGGSGSSKNKLGDAVASVEGTVLNVSHLMGQAGQGRPGYTKTFVSLEVPRGCFDKFATASNTVSYSNGKAVIDVAAFNYVSRKSLVAFCTQELKGEKINIELNGYFAENAITVNWLKGTSVDIKKGDLRVYKIDQITVVDASELCPSIEGRPSCRAIGSTINLSLTLGGCVDTLANIVTKVEPLEGRKVRLSISALGMANEASRLLRCRVAPVALHTLHTGYSAADAASVQLNILK